MNTTNNTSDGKTVAIVAHITLIGWIVAIIMNSNNKTEIGSFYIRQMLGLVLFGLLGFIPILGWLVAIAVIVFWILSLINAVNEKMEPIPLIGPLFQDWFKGI
ncbi:MAG: hypothetical protein ACKVOR_09385 [Flavobacteriales bacterium]